jgi:hypothetical protein
MSKGTLRPERKGNMAVPFPWLFTDAMRFFGDSRPVSTFISGDFANRTVQSVVS